MVGQVSQAARTRPVGWVISCEEGAWHPLHPTVSPTHPIDPTIGAHLCKAPAQKRKAAKPPESPSKRRVQDSPIRGSRDAVDATALVSQLAPELKDALRATMREIVQDVVEKAMASGSKTRAERAVDLANKREREAREIVV